MSAAYGVKSDPPIDPSELELVEDPRGGTRLKLRVKAGARQNSVAGSHAGALKVSVTAAPERGKANKAVLELLGRRLGLAPSSLELTAGHASPGKTVRVPLSARELSRRLAG